MNTVDCVRRIEVKPRIDAVRGVATGRRDPAVCSHIHRRRAIVSSRHPVSGNLSRVRLFHRPAHLIVNHYLTTVSAHASGMKTGSGNDAAQAIEVLVGITLVGDGVNAPPAFYISWRIVEAFVSAGEFVCDPFDPPSGIVIDPLCGPLRIWLARCWICRRRTLRARLRPKVVVVLNRRDEPVGVSRGRRISKSVAIDAVGEGICVADKVLMPEMITCEGDRPRSIVAVFELV